MTEKQTYNTLLGFVVIFVAFCLGGFLVWSIMEHKKVQAPPPMQTTGQPAPNDTSDRPGSPMTPAIVEQPEIQPSFHEQLTCAAAAERQHKKDGWTEKDNVTVSSHYNPKLGHCYAMYSHVDSSGGGVWTYRNVFDPVENHDIGVGEWKDSDWTEGKKQCSIDTPQGETKTCNSLTEFEALASEIYGLKR